MTRRDKVHKYTNTVGFRWGNPSKAAQRLALHLYAVRFLVGQPVSAGDANSGNTPTESPTEPPTDPPTHTYSYLAVGVTERLQLEVVPVRGGAMAGDVHDQHRL